mgnify:CR=1 FL=1|jgi:hypothetical protein
MLALHTVSSALVVRPATGSASLRTLSYRSRMAEPLAVNSWYDSGSRFEDELKADVVEDGAEFEVVGDGPGLSKVADGEPDDEPKPMSSSTPLAEDIWQAFPSVTVQGTTLKTWDIGKESTERVQLSMRSEGRPMNANVELWQTPSYVPTKFRVYTEDGRLRPVDAVIESPKHPKSIAVYNTGPLEFPFDVNVANTGRAAAYASLADATPDNVQGGRITSYVFGPEVESVVVLLMTDERNMKAKIE